MRVLPVEDDPMIGRCLRQSLQAEGVSVDCTEGGPDSKSAVPLAGHATLRLDLDLAAA